jgi:hypothetical protein
MAAENNNDAGHCGLGEMPEILLLSIDSIADRTLLLSVVYVHTIGFRMDTPSCALKIQFEFQQCTQIFTVFRLNDIALP